MSLDARVKAALPDVCLRGIKKALTYLGARNLTLLARVCGTDKWGPHSYTPHYQRYFSALRRRRVNLLEIGIGGYDRRAGGGSLRMWKHYFPKGRVVGIDIHDKSFIDESRIETRVVDQTDAQALTALSAEYGGFDIVIDDGSHVSADVIRTFGTLFPLLRPDGIYAIEDTQTSYWPSWGGGMAAVDSTTKYFQRLTDGLNHVEFPVAGYQPSYFDRHIVEMAFFHNLIIIRKGSNIQPSNCPEEVVKATQDLAGAAAVPTA